VQGAIATKLRKGAERLARAHLLLREHGKTICRDSQPKCQERPVEDACAALESTGHHVPPLNRIPC